MNSDSSSVSSRASSPDMDEITTWCRRCPGEGLSRNGSKAGGEGSKYKIKKQLSEQDLQQLRLKINGRERKRMHDLNLAMDGLRGAASSTGRACRAPAPSARCPPPPHLSALTASNMARISGETKDLLK
ncbi:unnamed protein product [Bubo scandiacus]